MQKLLFSRKLQANMRGEAPLRKSQGNQRGIPTNLYDNSADPRE